MQKILVVIFFLAFTTNFAKAQPTLGNLFGIDYEFTLSEYDFAYSRYPDRPTFFSKPQKEYLEERAGKLNELLEAKDLSFRLKPSHFLEHDFHLLLILENWIQNDLELLARFDSVIKKDPWTFQHFGFNIYPLGLLDEFLASAWVSTNAFLIGFERELRSLIIECSKNETPLKEAIKNRDANQFQQRVYGDLKTFTELLMPVIDEAHQQLTEGGQFAVQPGEQPPARLYEASEMAQRLLDIFVHRKFSKERFFEEFKVEASVASKLQAVAQASAASYIKSPDESALWLGSENTNTTFEVASERERESLRSRGVISSNRFSKDWWWTGGPQFAEIDFSNSKSLARILYKKNFRRKLRWIIENQNRNPDLKAVRVAINESLTGKPLSMELFVSDRGGNWRPMFFTRRGSYWVKEAMVRGEPVEKVCLRCHANENGKFSPRPSFLKTVEDFKEVGYRDEKLISELLKF